MDWILWIIHPFPIKHQKDDDGDDDDDDDGGGGGDDDYDYDSLEVWSNARVGGNMFKHHLNLPGNTQRLAVLWRCYRVISSNHIYIYMYIEKSYTQDFGVFNILCAGLRIH